MINLLGDSDLSQIPGQKLIAIQMTSALARPSNLLQNQEDTLGYLSTPDHLVRWHNAHLQGQFLTALHSPYCDNGNFFSELHSEVLSGVSGSSII